MSDENVPAYIGKKPCGCVVGAVVDDGKHPENVKEALHEFVDDGLIIERVTVGWVRENFGKCPDHRAKQADLFGGSA